MNVFSRWQEIHESRTECSSECGPGTYVVKHRCMQMPLIKSFGPRPIPTHMCNHIRKPDEQRTCQGLCKSANWTYGNWGPCSVTCGDNGYQHRTARCLTADNVTVSDDLCPRDLKLVKKVCNQNPCPEWDYGSWSSVRLLDYLPNRLRFIYTVIAI